MPAAQTGGGKTTLFSGAASSFLVEEHCFGSEEHRSLHVRQQQKCAAQRSAKHGKWCRDLLFQRVPPAHSSHSQPQRNPAAPGSFLSLFKDTHMSSTEEMPLIVLLLSVRSFQRSCKVGMPEVSGDVNQLNGPKRYFSSSNFTLH